MKFIQSSFNSDNFRRSEVCLICCTLKGNQYPSQQATLQQRCMGVASALQVANLKATLEQRCSNVTYHNLFLQPQCNVAATLQIATPATKN